MKTSRKAAHLLAGSIMTAATLIGGASVADAADIAARGVTPEEAPTEQVTFAYDKIKWTYTELDPATHASTADSFVKIRSIQGETESPAVESYYKLQTQAVWT